MALTTRTKHLVNDWLRHVNLSVDTTTLARMRAERLAVLQATGHFQQPVFPLPQAFADMDPDPVLEAFPRYAARFRDLEDPARNDVGYSFENEYFSSPDAEVLYTIVRETRPSTVIEVGSGYSTRLIRQAILDGALSTRIVSIDPAPRADVAGFADEIHALPVQALDATELSGRLNAGDVLFIDSSHVLATGNDVAHFYCRILPHLASGVLIHIHDVFLPYDYPEEWVVENGWDWNEQYLVHAMLIFGTAFDVLWAGYYLQRSLEGFNAHFPHRNGRRGQSLWLRKC